MPSAKFTVPKNGDTVTANQAFTISMAINNLDTGNFVNAEENYFAAPQQLNAQGAIVGHSHVVVETLTALDQTTPTDPNKFAFFKGLNAAAVGGILTADVTKGLPAGAYRLCSINSAANHQPAIVPIAQHGSLDDCVYVRLVLFFTWMASDLFISSSSPRLLVGLPPPPVMLLLPEELPLVPELLLLVPEVLLLLLLVLLVLPLVPRVLLLVPEVLLLLVPEVLLLVPEVLLWLPGVLPPVPRLLLGPKLLVVMVAKADSHGSSKPHLSLENWRIA